MSERHTPGPWFVETVSTSCGVCHKVGPFPGKNPGDEPRHACLYSDYPSKGNTSDDELRANAYLIAAAPDLLAACRKLIEWNDRENDHAVDFWERVEMYGSAFTAMHAAVEKATHQPTTNEEPKS